MYRDYMKTPVGLIEIQASTKGIRSINYCESIDKSTKPHNLINSCKQQLQEYFSGERKHFDILLDQQGTSFQQTVWQALLQIPYGNTVSYGDIAHMINNPKSVRAVGGANNKNTISIIVPCHRVIGADGKLVGYDGGLEKKSWLLKHEGSVFKDECSASYTDKQTDLFIN